MATLAVLLALAAMTVFAAIDLRAALLVSVFLLPWSGLDVDVGLRVTMYQVALAAVVIVSFLRLTQPGARPPPIAAGGLFAALLLYATIWSLLQLGFIPQVKVGDSALRGPTARAIIQIMLFVFAVSPVFLAPFIITRQDDILRMGRLYLASMTVLAVIGWLQLAVWYTTGSNPIPIEAFNAALGGSNSAAISGAFGFEALNIYRMNSLAGEPRELASGVTIALVMIQAQALATPRIAAGRLAFLWIFLFLTLLATFSTSGLALWLAASLILVPACWLFGVPIARSPRQLLGAGLAVALPFALAIAALEISGFAILSLLAERTIERLGSDGAIEDFDLAILAYLAADPAASVTGVGLGNAHLYATPYLDPLFAVYAEGNVFNAKSYYLRLISEIGLIGLLLFLAWYGWLAVKTRLALPAEPPLGAIIPMAGATLAITLGNATVIPHLFVVAGAMTALCAIAQRQAAPLHGTALRPA